MRKEGPPQPSSTIKSRELKTAAIFELCQDLKTNSNKDSRALLQNLLGKTPQAQPSRQEVICRVYRTSNVGLTLPAIKTRLPRHIEPTLTAPFVTGKPKEKPKRQLHFPLPVQREDVKLGLKNKRKRQAKYQQKLQKQKQLLLNQKQSLDAPRETTKMQSVGSSSPVPEAGRFSQPIAGLTYGVPLQVFCSSLQGSRKTMEDRHTVHVGTLHRAQSSGQLLANPMAIANALANTTPVEAQKDPAGAATSVNTDILSRPGSTSASAGVAGSSLPVIRRRKGPPSKAHPNARQPPGVSVTATNPSDQSTSAPTTKSSSPPSLSPAECSPRDQNKTGESVNLPVHNTPRRCSTKENTTSVFGSVSPPATSASFALSNTSESTGASHIQDQLLTEDDCAVRGVLRQRLARGPSTEKTEEDEHLVPGDAWPAEDAFSDPIHLPSGGSRAISLFGVYDGHGGCRCASFLKQRLEDLLQSPTATFDPIPTEDKKENETEVAASSSDPQPEKKTIQVPSADICGVDSTEYEQHLGCSFRDVLLRDPALAIRLALWQAETEFLRYFESDSSGSTVVVALLVSDTLPDGSVESKLYVANVGDTEAVIGRRVDAERNTTTGSLASSLQPPLPSSSSLSPTLTSLASSPPPPAATTTTDLSCPSPGERRDRPEQSEKEEPATHFPFLLTEKHSLHSEAERQRVEKAGGRIYNSRLAHPCYNPSLLSLGISRAVGDAGFKMKAFTGGKPSGLVAAPSGAVYTLSPLDEFLLIACDGLWDVMSYTEAVQLVATELRKGGNVSDVLVQEALRRGSQDNVTALIVQLAVIEGEGPTRSAPSVSMSASPS